MSLKPPFVDHLYTGCSLTHDTNFDSRLATQKNDFIRNK